MTEFTTKSGAPVVINPAPFEDALSLHNAVGNPVWGIKTDVGDGFSIDNTAQLHFMVSASTKPDVQALVMKCLSRSTYKGQKIDKTTFEAVEAREDYMEVAVACIKENVSPFVNSLFSQFSGVLEAMKAKPAVTPPSQ